MIATPDPTLDPDLRSWVHVAEEGDFPIQHLPLGLFRRPGYGPRAGVAIGDQILDLQAVLDERLFADLGVALPGDAFNAGSLNRFLALGPLAWRAVRKRVSDLLSAGEGVVLGIPAFAGRLLVPMAEADLLLPVEVGDFVDFYSSIEHASNMGRMFRPDTEPLLPNWRHLPVGYHGRAGSVVVSGTPVVRPRGQTNPSGDGPSWGPTRQLDIELELGFVVGVGNRGGARVPIDRAGDHIFGLVLVNDWSARDIQRWEYQPLGPFLGKSFATSVSPWIVPLAALEPFRVAGPMQDPPPLGYLSTSDDWAFDVSLEVQLSTATMRAAGRDPATISRTNARGLYWSLAQQLAHATSNGAPTRPGDLFASGTISGPEPGSEGSLIELTWRGSRPIALPDGSSRTFLEDGDEVVLRGWCEREGRPRIGFGDVRGTIRPASEG